MVSIARRLAGFPALLLMLFALCGAQQASAHTLVFYGVSHKQVLVFKLAGARPQSIIAARLEQCGNQRSLNVRRVRMSARHGVLRVRRPRRWRVCASPLSVHSRAAKLRLFMGAIKFRAAPVNVTLPTIGGSLLQGQTITASTGTWLNSPTSYAYQWKDCDTSGTLCTGISGATSSSYLIHAGDVGHTIKVSVTASNRAGSSTASSLAGAVILATVLSPPTSTSLPVISGTAAVGQVVSASTGSWGGSPTGYSYQWADCDSTGLNCTYVSGATSSTYAVASTDANHTLRVGVTASNVAGSTLAVSQPSALAAGSTGAVAPGSTGTVAPADTSPPTITGTATQGQVLSATTGAWSGSPTGYAYQWSDCDTSGAGCAAISGANSSSYTLAAGDIGHTVVVTVSATNGGGTTSAASAPTAVVVSSGSSTGSTSGGNGCTVTVTSASAVDSNVGPGAVVCLAAATVGGSATYGAVSISSSGSSSSPAVVEARPGDTITLPAMTVSGSYVTVTGFHVIGAGGTPGSGGVIFESGATHDVLDHNDVSETATGACGQAVRLLGTNGGTHVSYITLSNNRIHDTGGVNVGCEADAIYMQGWDNVTVTQNDIYNIHPNQSLCNGGNCHTDTLQSYLAGFATTGLTVTKNYVHDNSDTQGLAFLADGDISSGVNLSDNLELRMSPNTGVAGMQIGINSTGMIIRNNTYWGGTNGNVEANPNLAPAGSLYMDHNIFDDLEMENNGNGAPYPNTTESYNIFGSQPWSWSPSGTGDKVAASQTFMCSTAGAGGANICGNGTISGDDYRLASNPNGVGIDWAPSQFQYGP